MNVKIFLLTVLLDSIDIVTLQYTDYLNTYNFKMEGNTTNIFTSWTFCLGLPVNAKFMTIFNPQGNKNQKLVIKIKLYALLHALHT